MVGAAHSSTSFGQCKSNQEHVVVNYILIKINSDGARAKCVQKLMGFHVEC